jgi:hypothetical protein
MRFFAIACEKIMYKVGLHNCDKRIGDRGYMMPKWMITLLILISSVALVAAQTDTCQTLLNALETMEENCAGIGRNQACYANRRVDAAFYEETQASFTNVSDIVDVFNLESLSTAAYDDATEEWGVAVLNVQANLPNTLPGQTVLIILMGDTNLTNEVEPENAFVSDLVIPAETLVDSSNLRIAPSGESRVIGTAAFGTILDADARSSDNEWVRVVSDFGPAWIGTSIVDLDGRLNELPIYSNSTRGPMQAFSLSTGIGRTSCAEVPPSGVLIQGPKDVTVRLDINGMEFLAGSTFFVQILEGPILQIITIDGTVRSDNIILPAGFTATRPLNADGTAPAGSWQNVRPVTAEELALLGTLEVFNQSFFNYPVDAPSAEEIAQTTSAIQQGGVQTNSSGEQTIGPATGGSACRGLQPTSPISGFPYGSTGFYWDAAEGVDTYRVLVYAGGSQVASVDVAAPTTSTSINTGSFPQSDSYSWLVQGLSNGRVVCVSATVTLGRDTPPPAQSRYGMMEGDTYAMKGLNNLESIAVFGLSGTSFLMLALCYGAMALYRLRTKKEVQSE